MNWNPAFSRRHFIQLAALAGGLEAAGRLPLLGAALEQTQCIDAGKGPAVVKALLHYVENSRFPTPDASGLIWHYDILRWLVTWAAADRNDQTGPPEGNPYFYTKRYGTLRLKIAPGQDGLRIEASRETEYEGCRNRMDARAVCQPDAPHVLREWEIATWVQDVRERSEPRLQMREEGVIEDGRIRIRDAFGERVLDASGPVLCPWSPIALLWGEKSPVLPDRFNYLDELAQLKTGHVLVNEGEVQLPTKNGPVSMRSYRQTGMGLQPTHYLVDSEGRVQMVTHQIVALALRSTEAT
ncbi:hypothetical protein HQ520_13260 [bacterium]|nr:hypothetical protein [bacterium]